MADDSLLLPKDGLLNELDRKSVADAWSKFVVAPDTNPSNVRDEIAQSWRRSASSGMDPHSHRAPRIDDENALADLLSGKDALIGATKNTWELLADNLLDTESLVIVTDEAGVILNVHGNDELVEAATHKNVAAGFDWSETAAGTNAIGTAVTLEHPTIVRTAEHYCVAAKIWDCAAAPIRDLTDGEILGILDIASVGALSSSHALGFAITAAKQIEHALHSINLGRTISLLSWYRSIETQFDSAPTLLLDQKGRVIVANNRLYDLLGHAPEKLPLVDWMPSLSDDIHCTLLDTVRYEWTSEGSGMTNNTHWSGGVVVLKPGAKNRKSRQKSIENESRKSPPAFAHIITADPTFLDCIDVAARMAQSRAPVLLTGETGSGKELFATAIHASSPVYDGPFVAINCGTLSRELAVSELLGYEPGAFTGASPQGHAGKFEQANGGTIFLDEVGELPAEVQVHLLRVLQDNIVVRVGSDSERQTNVRVIAATNRNLESEAESGRFRMDLYFRLKVLNLGLPPLRERAGDIGLLCHRLIRRLHENYGLGLKTLSPDLLAAMHNYHWPGNVRELHGVIERMYILSGDTMLKVHDLPDEISRALAANTEPRQHEGTETSLDELEVIAIRNALSQSGHSLTQVASRLGISRSTLYRRMKDYGISRSP